MLAFLGLLVKKCPIADTQGFRPHIEVFAYLCSQFMWHNLFDKRNILPPCVSLPLFVLF